MATRSLGRYSKIWLQINPVLLLSKMPTNWYYRQSDQVIGPVSSATLRDLRKCGAICDETLVGKEGAQSWDSFEEAAEALAEDEAAWRAPQSQAAGGNPPRNGNILQSLIKLLEKTVRATIAAIQSEKTKSAARSVGRGMAGMGQRASDIAKTVSSSDTTKSAVARARNGAGQARDLVSGVVTKAVHTRSDEAAGSAALDGTTPTSPPAVSEQEARQPDGEDDRQAAHGTFRDAPASEAPDSPVSPPPVSRRSDRRFAMGILVALGCTGLIVFAISGMQNHPPSSGSRQLSSSEADYRSPCRRCAGSGQLLDQCRQCYGAGTIMSKAPNYDGLTVPHQPMQLPCPGCRGSGRMPVPCSSCRGSGKSS